MTDDPIEATITPNTIGDQDALAEWNPVSGEATAALLARLTLPEVAKAETRKQALRILARCGDPSETEPRRDAHLVVGEVQSGKTLSFTTLIALARDNEFPLVVVVAGTKRNLLQQTADRFQADMLANDGGLPPFRQFVAEDYNEQDLTGALRAAVDSDTPKEYRPTVVVFVLKHQARIDKLADDLEASVEVVGHVPTLIIDDEADQAGMNVARPGRESTVYAALARLRRKIPRNDMLMYTATPQAPLLMSVADEWSPKTVAVLRSGDGYVGGKWLFVDHKADFVRVISDADLAIALDPTAQDPPASLRHAILFFLIALAATQAAGDPRPLSMLIHPARTRDLHDRHNAWTRAIVEGIRQSLSDPADVAFNDLLSDLRPLYDEMAATVGAVPLTLEETATKIRYLVPTIEIRLVNSGAPDEIGPNDWGQRPGWIVIGGAKLDRGFTVENLAVTYMPRGTGTGAADAIQQRGRFFGYKQSYAGYLRGWLNADTADAFSRYVTHEESVVRGLRDVESTATPLREWKRQFLLDDQYRPTRKSAVRLPLTSWAVVAKNGWFVQRQPYEPDATDKNIEVFKDFVALAGDVSPDPRDPRSPRQHLTAVVPTSGVIPLLSAWGAVGADAYRLNGLLLALAADPELQQPDDLVLMFMDGYRDPEDPTQRRRRRLSVMGETPLHQGRAPTGAYAGDAFFTDSERMTVQLHLLRVASNDDVELADTVPALAVHLPNAPDFYIEP